MWVYTDYELRLTIEHAENKAFTSGERTCNDFFDLSNKMKPTTSVAVCRSLCFFPFIPLMRHTLTSQSPPAILPFPDYHKKMGFSNHF